MMRYDYNPFNKEFDDITTGDLTVLSSVAEGWYVEYKRTVVGASQIAKSVTAFANTYGGWLFYGIEEKSKVEAVAGTFCGIDAAEADGCLQRIRQAVAHQAQPTPFFKVKALHGPVDEIGLKDGRCIIVVQVPWGPEAPYVHKDGRIYRRVGDGSEPKEENDRFVLDRLWSRSEKILDEYADWIDRDLELSKNEENIPFLRIFFIADFWRDRGVHKVVSLAKLREILSGNGTVVSLPFENVYQSGGTFTCRQTSGQDPERLGLTWRLQRNFNSEVTIPLSKFNPKEVNDLREALTGYAELDRFVAICTAQRYHSPTIIDLNILMYVLLGLAQAQFQLARQFEWTGPMYAKIQISGVWRTIPFLDTAHLMAEYEKNGITLILRKQISVYEGRGSDSYLRLEGVPPEINEGSDHIIMAVTLFIHIANAMGVSVGIDPDGDGSDAPDAINEFVLASGRAVEVQKNRL